MLSTPLAHVPDRDALTSLVARLKQHVSEPAAVVEALRTLAVRLQKTRPGTAAWLTKVTNAFEAREVSPSLEAADDLAALAEALRHPEQAPEPEEAPADVTAP